MTPAFLVALCAINAMYSGPCSDVRSTLPCWSVDRDKPQSPETIARLVCFVEHASRHPSAILKVPTQLSRLAIAACRPTPPDPIATYPNAGSGRPPFAPRRSAKALVGQPTRLRLQPTHRRPGARRSTAGPARSASIPRIPVRTSARRGGLGFFIGHSSGESSPIVRRVRGVPLFASARHAVQTGVFSTTAKQAPLQRLETAFKRNPMTVFREADIQPAL